MKLKIFIHTSLFLLTFIFLFICFRLNEGNILYYDSANYINISTSSWGDDLANPLDFSHYHSAINRPYLWPFTITLMRLPAIVIGLNQYTCFYLIQIAIFAFFLTPLLPLYFIQLFRLKIQNHFFFTTKIVIFFLLIFFFWHGMFFQALSDFPALFCLIIALLSFLIFTQITKRMRGGVLDYLYRSRSY
jgi:hypothetical protein